MLYDQKDFKNYKIEEAVIQDCESITHIHIESWKSAYHGIIHQDYLNNINYNERFEFRKKTLINNAIISLVARYKNEIIGFCDAGALSFHSNQLLTKNQKRSRTEIGELYALYIIVEHQNKGIGKALFEEMICQMRKRHLTPLLAWVFKDNIRARNFYKKQQGFFVDETTVIIGDHSYQEIAYRFDL